MEAGKGSRVGLHGGGGYNTGYASHDDAMPLAVYEEWQRDVLDLCWDALSENGAIFYNHKPRAKGVTTWLPFMASSRLLLRQIIVWYRKFGPGLDPAHFGQAHEWVMLYARPGFRLSTRSAAAVSDVWEVWPEADDRGHPCPFPLKLPTLAIGATDAELVCDPFVGTGTTLRAAKDLGRRAIGIEVEERYCEIAAKRLAQEVLAL
jgi:modification methylase